MLYPVNLIVSIALALLLLLGGFGRESEADYVARSLDIDLPEPLSVTYGDSHGGFHGDGLLHIELAFDLEDRAAVEEEVSSHPSGCWNPFPMDGHMEMVVYGNCADTVSWPVPENGWWYLLDRQEDGEGGMLTRASFHYTFAVYDSDTGILYYQELDT